MIKFKATALSAIHTGADEKSGTLTKFRKKRVKLGLGEIESKFTTKTEQRKVFMSLLLEVYKEIDTKLKKKYYGYYDALQGNLLAAAGRATKWEFIDTLLCKCGIKNLRDSRLQVEVLQQFGDLELSMFVKSDIQLIIAMLRINVQEKREWWKQHDKLQEKAKELEKQIDKLKEDNPNFKELNASLNDEHVQVLTELHNTFTIKDIIVVESNEKPRYDTSIVEVPQISGNSIGGIMRDLLMKDYLVRIGIIEDIESEVENSLYHMMMTGGVITESTAYEDIEYRENFIRLCPPIGVLGTAAGSMTFESGLGIGHLELQCSENKTGQTSCGELLNVEFNTRRDDSKTESDVKIKGESKGKTAQQMIMYREVVIAGSVWDGEFWFNTYNELTKSCAWHGVQLFKEYGKLGGRINRGLGKMNFDIEIPKGATDLYLNHIKENKTEMYQKFNLNAVADAI